jgi:hypothetical protein
VLYFYLPNLTQTSVEANTMSLSCNNQSFDPVLGGSGGGGAGGDVPKCSRGGKKLRSNMGAKVNIDVELRMGMGMGIRMNMRYPVQDKDKIVSI